MNWKIIIICLFLVGCYDAHQVEEYLDTAPELWSTDGGSYERDRLIDWQGADTVADTGFVAPGDSDTDTGAGTEQGHTGPCSLMEECGFLSYDKCGELVAGMNWACKIVAYNLEWCYSQDGCDAQTCRDRAQELYVHCPAEIMSDSDD
jgi:hypothetical protein